MLSTDGRLNKVSLKDIQKRYSPEKHYVFILQVGNPAQTS